MNKADLQFPSAYALWKYKQVCTVHNLQVNFDKYTLSGNFKKEDLEKAVIEFQAKVISTDKLRE